MPFSVPKTLVKSNTLILEIRYATEKLQLQIAGLRRAKLGSSPEAIESTLHQIELTLEELITEQAAYPQRQADTDQAVTEAEAE